MISEISNGRYCEENGYFCPLMDRAGYCIATTCKHGLELLEMAEIDRLSQYAEEMAEGKVWLEGDKIHKDIEEEQYDIKGSWRNLHDSIPED